MWIKLLPYKQARSSATGVKEGPPGGGCKLSSSPFEKFEFIAFIKALLVSWNGKMVWHGFDGTIVK